MKQDPSEFQHEVLFEAAATTLPGSGLFIGRVFLRKRFLAAGLIILCVGMGLSARAAWMQIQDGPAYQQKAEANRLRRLAILPKRGIIRDRQNRVLADNIPRFQVTLTPLDLPLDRDEAEQAASRVARILGLSINDFSTYLSSTSTARDETYTLAENVPYDQAMSLAIALPDLPGFNLLVAARRRYPFSPETPSLSHVLGYVGKISPDELENGRADGYVRSDEIGKAGLEKSLEPLLRGVRGQKISEVDARGRIKASVGETPAVDGSDIRLTLDIDLQKAAESALREQLGKDKLGRGSVIAMDPRDGSILALVSWPAYDNNIFSGGVSSTAYQALAQNPDQPLFPRAWAGTYPSGSTVKIVIAVAALAEKVVTARTSILSVGGISVGPWFFPDWKAGGHGPSNVRYAIAWSVNTFFYTVGGGYESFVGLGVDKINQWMHAFGLGEKTGIDLPGEATGQVPTRELKEKQKGERWYVGDTYNLSIGQGDLLVTPLQVAHYTAEIANGGYKVVPHLASEAATTTLERIAPEEAVREARLGMRDNVTYGSGRALSDMAFPVAGKTGTAQWHSEKNTHAWFTSFAPFEKPEIVVTVLLEEGGEGSAVAVPVARRVLEAWWGLRQARDEVF